MNRPLFMIRWAQNWPAFQPFTAVLAAARTARSAMASWLARSSSRLGRASAMAAAYAPENPSDLPFRKGSLHQLSGVDALHVLEETPDQHMHTIKLALLAAGPDGVPSYADVRAWG